MQALTPILAVSDLKQFVYCPRIFYFMTVQPVRPPATGLMERGQRLQEEFERLEPRRVLTRYGFAEARRHFSITLRDGELGLTGQADLLLEAEDKLAVVEFKASGAALAENHRLQLAAYALLAERKFGRPCPVAYALFADREEIEEVPLGAALREEVSKALERMRGVLERGEFPPPTSLRARCHECEYGNFCGDIF